MTNFLLSRLVCSVPRTSIYPRIKSGDVVSWIMLIFTWNPQGLVDNGEERHITRLVDSLSRPYDMADGPTPPLLFLYSIAFLYQKYMWFYTNSRVKMIFLLSGLRSWSLGIYIVRKQFFSPCWNVKTSWKKMHFLVHLNNKRFI